MSDSRMVLDEEDRFGKGSPETVARDRRMDVLEENGGGGQDYDGVVDFRDKSRESGKHRSKDRNRSKEEKEHGSRHRDRSKERGRDDRVESRERRKDERENEKDRDRVKERSRDKMRERDYERDPHRGNERDRERERSYDHEHDRGKDREKDRGREREKIERDRDGDRGHKNKDRERDHEKGGGREKERDRVKEKDRDRGKDREREKEKDWDRVRDREREKEKSKDRDRVKDRDGERDKLEKGKNRDRGREKDMDKEADWDKPRAKNRDRETGRSKEGEKDEKIKAVAKKDDGDLDEHEIHERMLSKDTKEKTSELGERLKKVKEERLKEKSVSLEISSWLSKSRRLEEKRSVQNEKAAHLSKILDEQDRILVEGEDEDEAEHSREDLAGVKILHGLDKVMEGGAVVLTLKDQNILVDGNLNEDVDMLENVEIGEQRRRDEAYKAAKKTGTYDDKFSDDTGLPKPILPQYDDPVDDEGVTLDESGHFTGEAEKKLEELRKRIEGRPISKSYENLTSSGRISADYYTPDEMLQFKKPKKKKSLRKKDKLDLDALEAEAISTGLGAGDLGSRNDSKRQVAKEEQEKIEAAVRSNAYLSAYAKAEEASKILRQEQTLTVKTTEGDDLVFGEDYEDLQKSLEQARKLAFKRQEEEAASGPQAVALLAVANKEQGGSQSPTAGEPQENKVVITEMEEFVLGLQLNEESHKPESEGVFMDEDEGAKSYEREVKDDDGGGRKEVEEINEDQVPIVEEKEDVSPDEIIHENAIGKGLSGALKLLKERGTLKEDIDWGGRTMDKKKSKLVGINENAGPKEIRIERTDEFGRIMTPKEAFRMLSHKFHGKGPGKMKLEKRMKNYQMDLQTKQMKASDTPSQAMERMREAQALLKTPYLVLSGHVKPGQTSDPRSGFATVEKDHLGSLTPMLGDKKVEHFLGISRESNSGSMGPPPPKKPRT